MSFPLLQRQLRCSASDLPIRKSDATRFRSKPKAMFRLSGRLFRKVGGRGYWLKSFSIAWKQISCRYGSALGVLEPTGIVAIIAIKSA